jgi:hypothetical protein
MTFLDWHASEFVLIQNWARLAREDATVRWFCQDRINAIIDRLESLYAKQNPEAIDEIH